MTDTIRMIQERQPRYDIKNQEDVVVTIKGDAISTELVTLDLVNISVGGAKFKSDKRLQAGEVILVEIEVPRLRQKLLVTALIRWVSPVVAEGWSLGCSLQPQIPPEVLDRFAQAEVLERREYRREHVSLPAVARWELTGDITSAQVVDFSRGGFCVVMGIEGNPGDRVVLQFDRRNEPEILVHGKALWQIKSDDGFKIGCEFLNHQDYSVLMDLTNPQRTIRDNRHTAGKRTHTSLSILTLVAVLLTVCIWAMPFLWRYQATTYTSKRIASRRAPTGVEAEAPARQSPIVEPLHETAQLCAAGVWALEQILSADSPRLENGTAVHEDVGTAPRNCTQFGPRSTTPLKRLTMALVSCDNPAPATLLHPHVDENVYPNKGRSGSRHMNSHTPTASSDEQTWHTIRRKLPIGRQPSSNVVAILPTRPDEPKRARAAEAYRQGQDYFSLRQYEHANLALRTAIHFEPTNAEFHYLLAMIQYQQQQQKQAVRSVRIAVELEREAPLATWGQRMERYQGSARVWLEQTRLRVAKQLGGP